MEKSSFGKEENLQEYIHQHPEAIPIYDIQKDKRLFVAAREFSTESGPIDALAVDKDGEIYVIETKLYANADKRRVVAQALDYGASLWKHFGDFPTFIRLLDTSAQSQWSMGFQQKVIEEFSLDDVGVEAMLNRMADNLQKGNLKFVVLMDSMDERLKELIAYINLKSQFDIYGVELELYEYEDYKIVLPKLYGAEAKKDNPPPLPKPRMTEQELLKDIATRDPAQAQWAETLFARFRGLGLTAQGLAITLTYGVDLNGDFVPLLDFQAGGVYAGLRKGTIRQLTGEQFVRCKKTMNTLSPLRPFYPVSEVDDPTKFSSKQSPYETLISNDVELFVSTVKSIADIVSSAFAEKVRQEGGQSEADGDAVAFKDSSVLAEIVLELGAEGGSLTILRERIAEQGWQFRIKVDESALYDFLSKEDQGMNLVSQTGYVHSFDEALGLLNDSYPGWFRLYPLKVHPEFIDAVLAEVEKKGSPDDAARWLEYWKRMASRY